MVEKLVVVIMGQDCEKFIPMCLESVKDADTIVYCDGGSADKTLHLCKGFVPGLDEHSRHSNVNLKEHSKYVISHTYDQEDKTMNGKQRNYYLKFLKDNFKDYWCLVLDADEVVDDEGIKKIKDFINFLPKQNHDILFSLKMRHLIGDLAHEDTTLPVHFVPHRLFKVVGDLEYPEVEHPVLGMNKEFRSQNLMITTIWHMAYAPNLWDFKKRYECHLKKSQMHSPKWLRNWYKAFLFGEYPNQKFNVLELPKTILNEFGVDKDELYFHNRKEMEAKHYQDAIDWKDAFNIKDAILFGCGFGQRVYALRQLGISAWGIELSDYAVKNSLYPSTIRKGNILSDGITQKADLSVAYDMLEHLKYADLDKAIDALIQTTKKYILISVPFKGSPDLENDPTHIIKENKEWWIKQFTDKGLKLIPTSEHFLFKEQVLIFEKEENI